LYSSTVFNFRDLGGFETPSGPVRKGVLFRSNALTDLDDEGIASLRDAGLHTAVDLRQPAEAEQAPVVVPEGTFVLRRAPIGTASAIRRGGELRSYYTDVLGTYGESLAQAVSLLSDPENQPAVFFCTSGKDRTGMLAAVILSALGVSDEDAAADFARTIELWPPDQTARAVAAAKTSGLDAESVKLSVEAPPELMVELLEGLRARYGSAGDYLLANGLREEELQALRSSMLGRP
jgi:protein-tyrosine phosphatase